MISFGVGMESNILDTFKNNELFNSITVTELQLDMDEIMNGDIKSAVKDTNAKISPLNDSTLKIIRNIKGVAIAYPEISIPVKAVFGDNDEKISVAGFPLEIRNFPPYDNIKYGRFISSDSAKEIVISDNFMYRFNIAVKDSPDRTLTEKEKQKKFKLVEPDSILGKEITIYTASMFNNSAMPFAMPGMFTGFGGSKPDTTTLKSQTGYKFRIVGIQSFDKNRMNFSVSAAIISDAQANLIPRPNFRSVWDLLDKSTESKSIYQSITVRSKDPADVPAIKKKLEKMNFKIFAFIDQLEEIRSNFIIMDLFLSAVGIIALFVAGLGIINTMVMSILERKKEIGIMKAIGGGESEIRKIFFVEASIIGLLGGIMGLILGWSVTKIATFIINNYALPAGVPKFDFFSFPLWLIGGAIIFSLIISLIAGMYPAYRAAKVDPVIALRNE
jgi:putative ABC transport system permease protein